MRIVFFGTPKFAADILEELVRSEHEVVAVYTKRDNVRKRGRELVACEAKEVALSHSIHVDTPDNLRDLAAVEDLEKFGADAFCVAAYGCIFPKRVLDIPRHGCINVHASLLPRWRGAAPIERAILAGDEVQGVSIMKMNEGMDTGDYCLQSSVVADDKSSSQLRDELAQVGANQLLEALKRIEDGTLEWEEQDEARATQAPKIEKVETILNPNDSALLNFRRVLASSDSAPARCLIDDRACRIVSASLTKAEAQAGQVSCDKSVIYLGCSDGSLRVELIKPDGKKEMVASSFVAGSKSVRDNTARWQTL